MTGSCLLFTEASGELRSGVEDELEHARESLPAEEALVAKEDTTLSLWRFNYI
jgi:hypothetical protein